MLTDEAVILEGYTIGANELKVGDPTRRFGSARAGLREPFTKQTGQLQETVTASLRDLLRRVVGAEELPFVILVERDQRPDSPGHPSMPGNRSMFRSRQFEACLRRPHGRGSKNQRAGGCDIELDGHRFAFCGSKLIP